MKEAPVAKDPFEKLAGGPQSGYSRRWRMLEEAGNEVGEWVPFQFVADLLCRLFATVPHLYCFDATMELRLFYLQRCR